MAQLRREDDFLCLLTTMMLLDDKYYDNFKIKTSASAAECVRFAETIKGNYSDEKKKLVESLIDYLSEAFGDKEYKFLRKNNIPIVMYVGFVCLNHGVSAEEYKTCVIDFFSKGCTEAYNEASGSGNVKMINVNIRLKELISYIVGVIPEYFKDDIEFEQILYEVTNDNSSEEDEVTQEDPPTDAEEPVPSESDVSDNSYDTPQEDGTLDEDDTLDEDGTSNEDT